MGRSWVGSSSSEVNIESYGQLKVCSSSRMGEEEQVELDAVLGQIALRLGWNQSLAWRW